MPNINKLLMAGAGVAVGVAMFAGAIRLAENVEALRPAANFFKDAFGRV